MYSTVENSAGSVPAFLVKLWSLVEDTTTDDLISWDTGGTSFHVYDQQRFSKEILPLYFKHNNIASFIRQLNMYGFRKVTHIDQGGLKIEKDDLHFQHQFFQKGERDMLQYIKRKVSTPLVRPVSEGVVSTNSSEVSRVLTDVKQVKTKQEAMDSNLEYIKRENKLLWREIALLRQKHHKQQQIVNKLIQFLVSLVSSNRTGRTIPSLRRGPLAIGSVSQAAQGLADSAAGSTVASLIQQNLADMGSSVKEEIEPSDVSEYLIDDTEYTIESPRSDGIMSPPTNSTGPIIHELTDILPIASSQQIHVLPQARPQPVPVVVNNQARQISVLPQAAPQAVPVVLNKQGQIVAAKPVGQQNIILKTAGQAATNALTSATGDRRPFNVVIVPTTQPPAKSQPRTAPSATTILVPTPITTNSIGIPATHIASGMVSPGLMSPKVEPAPTLEDALQFGLNVPSSSPVRVAAPQTKVVVGKKRPPTDTGQMTRVVSPAKKSNVPASSSVAQPQVLQLNSNNTHVPVSQMQLQGMSPAQAASLSSLVQANSNMSNSSSQVLGESLPSASCPVGSNISPADSDGSMALAASSGNKDGGDPLLECEQLDLLSSDLDGLKNILQEQYKVDPNFFMELFDMSNPWNTEADKELEDLSSDADRDTASTSGTGLENITGQELVEYNPQDSLFPEEMLMGDGFQGDIEDIDDID